MGREGSDKHYASPLEAFLDIHNASMDNIVAFSVEREDALNDVLYLAMRVDGRVEAQVVFVERDAEGTMIKWLTESAGPTATNPSLAVMQALDPLPTDGSEVFAGWWRAEAWRNARRAERAQQKKRREYPGTR